MKRLLLVICMMITGNLARAQSAPPLASAQSFAILGATTVTSTGATVVTGDLGVSPGTAVTGSPTVTGGTIHANDATAVAAQADAHTAYNALVAEPCGTDLTGRTLGTSPGAVTLSPGVYCFPGTSAQLTGILTLSGNGVYVFQIGSTLTTATSSSVVLTNGAKAASVFWQVGSSATFGTGTAFVGSLLALVSATVTTGTSVDGRVFALTGAVTMDTNAITAAASGVGRWEIVHTSQDSAPQSALYPGGFSTFLRADGTGNTYGTFTSSLCVIDAESFNIVPTWVALGGNMFQITITVDNLGQGPNFAFIYNGTYDFHTAVPGNASLSIPAITGTYYATGGDVSACSLATPGSPGHFVATFLPTISSGAASGSLDGFNADNGSAFDATVSATITFSAPPAPGQIAGMVSLGSNPTFNNKECFATATNGVVAPLNINSNRSSQSGISEYMFAEGLDPHGIPTTLFLNGFSANQYTAATNTNRNAIGITTTDWVVPAAIGEDNFDIGVTGVSNDGTNSVIVVLYGVLGGACNNAGGVDAPFHFLSGTRIVHKHKVHRRRGNRGIANPGREEDRED
jgi:Ice-binding-like